MQLLTNDEQPSPGTKSSDTSHVLRDARCNQSREGTRDQRTGIENCSSQHQFLPRVPRGEIIEATGLFDVSMPKRHVASVRTYKVCGLHETEEEATRNQATE